MSAIPVQNSSEWEIWRRGGLGASEFPAILGEDPYRSEYEMALSKRGEMEQEQTLAMAWGHRVQRMALEAYAESTGLRIRQVHTTGVSRTHPHVYASLDGRVVGERRGVEVKLTRQWEEPPRRVVIQAQVQMGVHRLDAVDVVRVGMGYQEPAAYTIERDDMLIHELMELGEAWYVRYVLGDEMPPIDGSRGASKALDRIEGPPEMVADGEQAAMVTRIHQLKASIKADQAEHDTLVNRLKESMAGAYALRGEGFRVSWKPSKPRRTTDWRAVVGDLTLRLNSLGVSSDEVAEAIEGHTDTGGGSRPFRLTVEEEA